MRYAGLVKNDIVDGDNGIVVSFWVQGCPHHCPGCHNPETWSFYGGKELPDNILEQIDKALVDNGIQRNFSILGGEPLCRENRKLVSDIIDHIRVKFIDINIYVWSGYIYEDLLLENDNYLKNIFSKIDYLIDGPFIVSQRDITLKLRGSRNQRILKFENNSVNDISNMR